MIPKVRFHVAVFPVKVSPILQSQRNFAAPIDNRHNLMESNSGKCFLQFMATPFTFNKIWCKYCNCFFTITNCLRNVLHNCGTWHKIFEVYTAGESSLFELCKEFILHPADVFVAVTDEDIVFWFII